MNKLHLYPQYHEHDHASIVGTREALTALRDALTRVLDGPLSSDFVRAFPEDGEGFSLVLLRTEDPKVWEALDLPYADRPRYIRQREDGKYAIELIDDAIYDQLYARPSGGPVDS